MTLAQASSTLVQARLDSWRSRVCPFCGHLPNPWWMSLWSTVTLSCCVCGEVIEGFEVYEDHHGRAWMVNHQFPTPKNTPTP